MAIPFKDGGRDFAGCNCMSFCLLIVANEAKINIDEAVPSYTDKPRSVMRKIESEIHSGLWMKVAEGNGEAIKYSVGKFDFVLMTGHVRSGGDVRNRDLHVGLGLGNGRLVHLEEGCGAQYVEMDNPEICNRIKAAYRPKALCT